MVDRPIVGEGWIRVNLGHIITIATVVGGFILQAISVGQQLQAAQDRMAGLSGDVTELKSSIKSIEIGLQTNALTVTSMHDDIEYTKKRLDDIDRHLETSDAKIIAQDKLTQALESEMSIINQALQLKHGH